MILIRIRLAKAVGMIAKIIIILMVSLVTEGGLPSVARANPTDNKAPVSMDKAERPTASTVDSRFIIIELIA